MSIILLVKKGVEVLFRRVQILSGISHQEELFGVDDIMNNQYVVRTKSCFPNSSLCQEVVNLVIPLSIQTWHCRLGHLGYHNILRLPKVADGIDVKGPIPDKIYGDCMKKRQQRKPSCELML